MESEANGTGHGHQNGANTHGVQPAEEVLDVNSEAFRTINARRNDLIDKKYQDDGSDGLTDDEQVEFERLQGVVGAALEHAYPRPTLVDDVLAAVQAHLLREHHPAHEATIAE